MSNSMYILKYVDYDENVYQEMDYITGMTHDACRKTILPESSISHSEYSTEGDLYCVKVPIYWSRDVQERVYYLTNRRNWTFDSFEQEQQFYKTCHGLFSWLDERVDKINKNVTIDDVLGDHYIRDAEQKNALGTIADILEE